MSYLRHLYVFVYSGVQHILCCVFLRLVASFFEYPILIASSVSSSVLFFFHCIFQAFAHYIDRIHSTQLYLQYNYTYT